MTDARATGRLYDDMLRRRPASASPAELERIERLVEMVPPGTSTVLEVGAGDGRVARRIAACGPLVVGADVAEDALRRAGVTAVVADAGALPFADMSFDLVAASELLEHIPPANLVSVASEFARVARRHILVSVPDREDLLESRARCRDCGAVFHVWDHRNRFDRRALRGLWPDWTIVESAAVGRHVRLPWFVPLATMQAAGYLYRAAVQGLACPACGSERLLGMRGSRLEGAMRVAVEAVRRCLGRRLPQWTVALFERTGAPGSRSEAPE